MVVLRRRTTPSEDASEYAESVKREEPTPSIVEDKIVSTGSTLIDLSIFGGRIRGGGLPGGMIVEIFSESGLGKTALISEICGCSQSLGGEVQFRDPEGRLDKNYAEIYGVSLQGNNYGRPNYVHEVFNEVRAWDPPNKNVVNVFSVDSLAALTTELEMGEKGDKMGMRRAKEFSEGLRKTGRVLADGGYRSLVCSNQLRTGDSGTFTPGGKGIPYWSSIRIQILTARQVNRNKENFILQNIKVGDKDKEISKVRGINCVAKIVKNSKDDPFREAPFSIVFGYGLDDIRSNLQWYKDMTGGNSYDCTDGKTYRGVEYAIKYIEDNSLETDLKENVIDLWEEIEEKFKKSRERKRKIR